MSEWKNIGTLLIEYGLITETDLKEGISHQEKSGIRLGEALVKLGKVSMEDIDYVLSRQLDIPFVIVEDITVDPDLLSQFEKTFLIQNKVLPLHESHDQISIVMQDPFNRSAIDTVSDTIKKKVNVSSGNGDKIEELLRVSFEKVGIPTLVSSIKEIIEKIRDTSFYRIDFFLDEHECSISVFGNGIIKEMLKVKAAFNKEDVFRSFDSLDIPLLYDIACSEGSTFLAIYPLTNRMPLTGYPVIVGCYGLYLPDHVSFADANVYRMPHLFHSSDPPMGYPFLTTKTGHTGHDMIIYTLDSMPKKTAECYVHTFIPEVCIACNGHGCNTCSELGYTFYKMEGMYSAEDIRKRMKDK